VLIIVIEKQPVFLYGVLVPFTKYPKQNPFWFERSRRSVWAWWISISAQHIAHYELMAIKLRGGIKEGLISVCLKSKTS